jgi:nucleoid-associated protein YgaU
MKKTIIAFIVLAFIVTAAQAQSLVDNTYYRKSLQLEAAARVAFDEGEYDEAADLAAQAQENARLSDEYVAMILSMRTARKAIDSAQARYDWATGVRAQIRFPEDYAGATASLAAARAAFTAERYDDATTHAYTVDAYLAAVTDEQALPAYFVVRELEKNTDCLWRIAGLPFIYNDPLKWPLLYQANKKALPNPANPDLILPGMTLSIPPLANELRDGVWIDGEKYPTFGIAE